MTSSNVRDSVGFGKWKLSERLTDVKRQRRESEADGLTSILPSNVLILSIMDGRDGCEVCRKISCLCQMFRGF